MIVGHSRPSEKGYRDVVSGGNRVRVWRNREQSVESYLFPIDSEVVVNSREVEFQ